MAVVSSEVTGGASVAAEAPPSTAVPGAADPVVDVTNLHVTFQRGGRDVRAVRGVDLRIGKGEILGLVGESGSGKSVLGLSLLGLLPTLPPPSVEGVAMVCGVDMVSASAEERRQLRARH